MKSMPQGRGPEARLVHGALSRWNRVALLRLPHYLEGAITTVSAVRQVLWRGLYRDSQRPLFQASGPSLSCDFLQCARFRPCESTVCNPSPRPSACLAPGLSSELPPRKTPSHAPASRPSPAVLPQHEPARSEAFPALDLII